MTVHESESSTQSLAPDFPGRFPLDHGSESELQEGAPWRRRPPPCGPRRRWNYGPAWLNLAEMYSSGFEPGVEANPPEAAKCYCRVAPASQGIEVYIQARRGLLDAF